MIHRLLLLPALLVSFPVSAGPDRVATLQVSRMDCAACPITVRTALEKVPGVGSAKVNFKAKQAIVSFDPARTSPESLTQATASAGFPSTVLQLQRP
ncbi:MAG: mercury resistance system periplasmic binding protein MerP [Burkholderiales bacterium]